MITPLILTYMSGSEDGRTDVISVDSNDAIVIIGRLPDCTISIADDPDASRQHARIFRRDGEWWLEDMSSANGTFIGEFAQSRKITAPVKLVAGQIFRVGLTRFRLEKEGYQVNKLMMANVTENAAK
ncbi:MAG: FHA domain-containing protein [Sulfurimicrobium sp.]|nr:FHA domain-containing protein [Sulfurimicrobium sp.]